MSKLISSLSDFRIRCSTRNNRSVSQCDRLHCPIQCKYSCVTENPQKLTKLNLQLTALRRPSWKRYGTSDDSAYQSKVAPGPVGYYSAGNLSKCNPILSHVGVSCIYVLPIKQDYPGSPNIFFFSANKRRDKATIARKPQSPVKNKEWKTASIIGQIVRDVWTRWVWKIERHIEAER